MLLNDEGGGGDVHVLNENERLPQWAKGTREANGYV